MRHFCYQANVQRKAFYALKTAASCLYVCKACDVSNVRRVNLQLDVGLEIVSTGENGNVSELRRQFSIPRYQIF